MCELHIIYHTLIYDHKLVVIDQKIIEHPLTIHWFSPSKIDAKRENKVKILGSIEM